MRSSITSCENSSQHGNVDQRKMEARLLGRLEMGRKKLARIPNVRSGQCHMAICSDVREVLFQNCCHPHCDIVLEVLKWKFGYPKSEKFIHPCKQTEQMEFLRKYVAIATGTLLVDLRALDDPKCLMELWDLVLKRHKTTDNPSSVECYKNLEMGNWASVHGGGDSHRELVSISGRTRPANALTQHLPAITRHPGSICQEMSACCVPLTLLCETYPQSQGFLIASAQRYIMGTNGDCGLESINCCSVEEGVTFSRFLYRTREQDTSWTVVTSRSLLMSLAEFRLGYCLFTGRDENLGQDIILEILNSHAPKPGTMEDSNGNKVCDHGPPNTEGTETAIVGSIDSHSSLSSGDGQRSMHNSSPKLVVERTTQGDDAKLNKGKPSSQPDGCNLTVRACLEGVSCDVSEESSCDSLPSIHSLGINGSNKEPTVGINGKEVNKGRDGQDMLDKDSTSACHQGGVAETVQTVKNKYIGQHKATPILSRRDSPGKHSSKKSHEKYSQFVSPTKLGEKHQAANRKFDEMDESYQKIGEAKAKNKNTHVHKGELSSNDKQKSSGKGTASSENKKPADKGTPSTKYKIKPVDRRESLTVIKNMQVDRGTSSTENRNKPGDRGTSSTENNNKPVDRGTSSTNNKNKPLGKQTSSTEKYKPVDRQTSSAENKNKALDRRTSSTESKNKAWDRWTSAAENKNKSGDRWTSSAEAKNKPVDRGISSAEDKTKIVDKGTSSEDKIKLVDRERSAEAKNKPLDRQTSSVGNKNKPMDRGRSFAEDKQKPVDRGRSDVEDRNKPMDKGTPPCKAVSSRSCDNAVKSVNGNSKSVKNSKQHSKDVGRKRNKGHEKGNRKSDRSSADMVNKDSRSQPVGRKSDSQPPKPDTKVESVQTVTKRVTCKTYDRNEENMDSVRGGGCKTTENCQKDKDSNNSSATGKDSNKVNRNNTLPNTNRNLISNQGGWNRSCDKLQPVRQVFTSGVEKRSLNKPVTDNDVNKTDNQSIHPSSPRNHGICGDSNNLDNANKVSGPSLGTRTVQEENFEASSEQSRLISAGVPYKPVASPLSSTASPKVMKGRLVLQQKLLSKVTSPDCDTLISASPSKTTGSLKPKWDRDSVLKQYPSPVSSPSAAGSGHKSGAILNEMSKLRPFDRSAIPSVMEKLNHKTTESHNSYGPSSSTTPDLYDEFARQNKSKIKASPIKKGPSSSTSPDLYDEFARQDRVKVKTLLVKQGPSSSVTPDLYDEYERQDKTKIRASPIKKSGIPCPSRSVTVSKPVPFQGQKDIGQVGVKSVPINKKPVESKLPSTSTPAMTTLNDTNDSAVQTNDTVVVRQKPAPSTCHSVPDVVHINTPVLTSQVKAVQTTLSGFSAHPRPVPRMQGSTTLDQPSQYSVTQQNKFSVAQQSHSSVALQNHVSVPQQNRLAVSQQTHGSVLQQNQFSVVQQISDSVPGQHHGLPSQQSHGSVLQQNQFSLPQQNQSVAQQSSGSTVQQSHCSVAQQTQFSVAQQSHFVLSQQNQLAVAQSHSMAQPSQFSVVQPSQFSVVQPSQFSQTQSSIIQTKTPSLSQPVPSPVLLSQPKPQSQEVSAVSQRTSTHAVVSKPETPCLFQAVVTRPGISLLNTPIRGTQVSTAPQVVTPNILSSPHVTNNVASPAQWPGDRKYFKLTGVDPDGSIRLIPTDLTYVLSGTPILMPLSPAVVNTTQDTVTSRRPASVGSIGSPLVYQTGNRECNRLPVPAPLNSTRYPLQVVNTLGYVQPVQVRVSPLNGLNCRNTEPRQNQILNTISSAEPVVKKLLSSGQCPSSSKENQLNLQQTGSKSPTTPSAIAEKTQSNTTKQQQLQHTLSSAATTSVSSRATSVSSGQFSPRITTAQLFRHVGNLRTVPQSVAGVSPAVKVSGIAVSSAIGQTTTSKSKTDAGILDEHGKQLKLVHCPGTNQRLTDPVSNCSPLSITVIRQQVTARQTATGKTPLSQAHTTVNSPAVTSTLSRSGHQVCEQRSINSIAGYHVQQEPQGSDSSKWAVKYSDMFENQKVWKNPALEENKSLHNLWRKKSSSLESLNELEAVVQNPFNQSVETLKKLRTLRCESDSSKSGESDAELQAQSISEKKLQVDGSNTVQAEGAYTFAPGRQKRAYTDSQSTSSTRANSDIRRTTDIEVQSIRQILASSSKKLQDKDDSDVVAPSNLFLDKLQKAKQQKQDRSKTAPPKSAMLNVPQPDKRTSSKQFNKKEGIHNKEAKQQMKVCIRGRINDDNSMSSVKSHGSETEGSCSNESIRSNAHKSNSISSLNWNHSVSDILRENFGSQEESGNNAKQSDDLASGSVQKKQGKKKRKSRRRITFQKQNPKRKVKWLCPEETTESNTDEEFLPRNKTKRDKSNRFQQGDHNVNGRRSTPGQAEKETDTFSFSESEEDFNIRPVTKDKKCQGHGKKNGPKKKTCSEKMVLEKECRQRTCAVVLEANIHRDKGKREVVMHQRENEQNLDSGKNVKNSHTEIVQNKIVQKGETNMNGEACLNKVIKEKSAGKTFLDSHFQEERQTPESKNGPGSKYTEKEKDKSELHTNILEIMNATAGRACVRRNLTSQSEPQPLENSFKKTNTKSKSRRGKNVKQTKDKKSQKNASNNSDGYKSKLRSANCESQAPPIVVESNNMTKEPEGENENKEKMVKTGVRKSSKKEQAFEQAKLKLTQRHEKSWFNRDEVKEGTIRNNSLEEKSQLGASCLEIRKKLSATGDLEREQDTTACRPQSPQTQTSLVFWNAQYSEKEKRQLLPLSDTVELESPNSRTDRELEGGRDEDGMLTTSGQKGRLEEVPHSGKVVTISSGSGKDVPANLSQVSVSKELSNQSFCGDSPVHFKQRWLNDYEDRCGQALGASKGATYADGHTKEGNRGGKCTNASVEQNNKSDNDFDQKHAQKSVTKKENDAGKNQKQSNMETEDFQQGNSSKNGCKNRDSEKSQSEAAMKACKVSEDEMSLKSVPGEKYSCTTQQQEKYFPSFSDSSSSLVEVSRSLSSLSSSASLEEGNTGGDKKRVMDSGFESGSPAEVNDQSEPNLDGRKTHKSNDHQRSSNKNGKQLKTVIDSGQSRHEDVQCDIQSTQLSDRNTTHLNRRISDNTWKTISESGENANPAWNTSVEAIGQSSSRVSFSSSTTSSSTEVGIARALEILSADNLHAQQEHSHLSRNPEQSVDSSVLLSHEAVDKKLALEQINPDVGTIDIQHPDNKISFYRNEDGALFVVCKLAETAESKVKCEKTEDKDHLDDHNDVGNQYKEDEDGLSHEDWIKTENTGCNGDDMNYFNIDGNVNYEDDAVEQTVAGSSSVLKEESLAQLKDTAQIVTVLTNKQEGSLTSADVEGLQTYFQNFDNSRAMTSVIPGSQCDNKSLADLLKNAPADTVILHVVTGNNPTNESDQGLFDQVNDQVDQNIGQVNQMGSDNYDVAVLDQGGITDMIELEVDRQMALQELLINGNDQVNTIPAQTSVSGSSEDWIIDCPEACQEEIVSGVVECPEICQEEVVYAVPSASDQMCADVEHGDIISPVASTTYLHNEDTVDEVSLFSVNVGQEENLLDIDHVDQVERTNTTDVTAEGMSYLPSHKDGRGDHSEVAAAIAVGYVQLSTVTEDSQDGYGNYFGNDTGADDAHEDDKGPTSDESSSQGYEAVIQNHSLLSERPLSIDYSELKRNHRSKPSNKNSSSEPKSKSGEENMFIERGTKKSCDTNTGNGRMKPALTQCSQRSSVPLPSPVKETKKENRGRKKKRTRKKGHQQGSDDVADSQQDAGDGEKMSQFSLDVIINEQETMQRKIIEKVSGADCPQYEVVEMKRKSGGNTSPDANRVSPRAVLREMNVHATEERVPVQEQGTGNVGTQTGQDPSGFTFKLIADEENNVLGGLAFYREWVFPFVFSNGYKFTSYRDAMKCFGGCMAACTIPRNVLHKHPGLARSYSIWEQVYQLELIKMKKGPTVKTGDLLIRLDSFIPRIEELQAEIIRRHKDTKLKRSQECQLAREQPPQLDVVDRTVNNDTT